MAKGHITLIGGGPGDPELITVAGYKALLSADVVLADRLGPTALLADLSDDVAVIDVGKGPGCHVKTQDETNELLVKYALEGKHVVRLKGGDPFVLGRGGEEVLYAAKYGISTRVIPGVTSAISVPGAAGIPVTHRGIATGFTVVSGHTELADVPVRSDHTLAVLMGVSNLPLIVETLLTRGLPSSTPIAIVERGYSQTQRTTIGTLEEIVVRARKAAVANPAVIVIGDVVRLAPEASDQLVDLLPLENADATEPASFVD
ncbi:MULTISPECIES: uroporphyrinogen-III C-methyltransferase [Micrococcaceae]|uniref:uroporphyrinogen-III C-methyltransferase n=1 Tax=Micrococcaceae TaxID=1268 RepID=UPI001035588D|nr:MULTISPECIES: uroporphyrinogen-III C-methyltransferase [Micrococcaceae]TAP27459.1 uroporphyrinogen-III C-methyltransferase [Arthrobacter sp. S41]UXN30874.1 uroporphyrinogen-III C-methyltransferase [Glutamicibacter sp. M10]